jgi:hypothetical protein
MIKTVYIFLSLLATVTGFAMPLPARPVGHEHPSSGPSQQLTIDLYQGMKKLTSWLRECVSAQCMQ